MVKVAVLPPLMPCKLPKRRGLDYPEASEIRVFARRAMRPGFFPYSKP